MWPSRVCCCATQPSPRLNLWELVAPPLLTLIPTRACATWQILLDENARKAALGATFYSCGGGDASDNQQLYAWCEDTVGREHYTLRVKVGGRQAGRQAAEGGPGGGRTREGVREGGAAGGLRLQGAERRSGEESGGGSCI